MRHCGLAHQLTTCSSNNPEPKAWMPVTEQSPGQGQTTDKAVAQQVSLTIVQPQQHWKSKQ
ncbi:MAG: hypothetical protein Tsb0027_09650 [Wenzhouxiangellaceae bacterium]